MGKTNDWLDFDLLAEDKLRDALKPPSMYKVILVNDDYTPMEFVIDVLQKFFSYVHFDVVLTPDRVVNTWLDVIYCFSCGCYRKPSFVRLSL